MRPPPESQGVLPSVGPSALTRGCQNVAVESGWSVASPFLGGSPRILVPFYRPRPPGMISFKEQYAVSEFSVKKGEDKNYLRIACY